MTYRQLFDEALGEPPPPTVDIDAVVAREDRRSRRRRVGAYASSATAVLALALGVGAVAGSGPAEGPTPAAGVASTGASVDDRERLRTAMLAAIAREAPDLRWVEGAVPVTDETLWNGPLTNTPTWAVQKVDNYSTTGWSGVGVVGRGDLRSYLWIEVGRMKDGGPAWPQDCDGRGRACRAFTGPGGEIVVTMDLDAWRARTTPPTPIADRMTTANRPDGTVLRLHAFTGQEKHLLTVEQMTAIALDPAIALPER